MLAWLLTIGNLGVVLGLVIVCQWYTTLIPMAWIEVGLKIVASIAYALLAWAYTTGIRRREVHCAMFAALIYICMSVESLYSISWHSIA